MVHVHLQGSVAQEAFAEGLDTPPNRWSIIPLCFRSPRYRNGATKRNAHRAYRKKRSRFSSGIAALERKYENR